MEIPYEEKITPDPFKNEFGWAVKKPTLEEIKNIRFNTYYVYQSFLGMDIKFFMENYATKDLQEFYYTMPEDLKEETTLYSLVKEIKYLSEWYKVVFNFFSPYEVVYEDGVFFQVDYPDGNPEAEKVVLSHINTAQQFDSLKECLMSVCNIRVEQEEEFIVAPGSDYEMARRIYEKLKAAREAERKRKKEDKTYSLPNIIGAVASYYPAYTFFNIWGLTICQLYYLFDRLQINAQFKMSETHVSVWGDESGKFDPTLWFKTLE